MISIKKLWESMPRELQRKASLHTLKQTVDAYNGEWESVESSPRDGVVRCMGWLDSIQKQAFAYRNEDNGDESKWSIYNQGRADALDRMEEDLRRMLSNGVICKPDR